MPRFPAASGARPLLLALALALAAGPAADARVFTRWRAGSDMESVMEAASARLVYDAPLTVNGGSGELRIYGLDEPLSDVARDLRATMPALTLRGGDGTLAIGQAEDDGHVLRVVVVQPDPFGPTMVFAFRQTDAEHRKSATPPAADALPGIPALPQATPHFYARDARTAMALLISTADTEPAAAADAMHARVRDAGWTPLATTSASLRTYARADATLYVLAIAGADGGAVITVLHKQTSMK